jgi:hypothetical protein
MLVGRGEVIQREGNFSKHGKLISNKVGFLNGRGRKRETMLIAPSRSRLTITKWSIKRLLGEVNVLRSKRNDDTT